MSSGTAASKRARATTPPTIPSRSLAIRSSPVYFAPDEPGSASSNTFPNSYLADGVSSSNNLTLQNNQAKYTNASISSTRIAAGKFPGFNCATAPIVPLTTSRSVVEAGIDAMTASGSTVIPEGLAWGWRVGSASVPFTEGSGNADGFWRKVIVLMTDGENNVVTTDWSGNETEVNATNGSFYSAFGYGKAATGNRFGTTDSYALDTSLNTKTQTLCTNIKAPTKTDPKDKAKTIPVYEIYTVVFDLNSTTVETLLRNCATDPEHYANASSSEQLKTIFAQIGERLKSMYLTK